MIIFAIAVSSCRKSEITVPPPNTNSNLDNTTSLSDTVMKKMEAIYKLTDGSTLLGTEFVCKVSKYKVSFFSNESGLFIILNYGLNPTDSSIQFSGFWRYSESKAQGQITLSVAKSDGASDFLLNGSTAGLKFTGFVSDENGNDPQAIQWGFERSFTQYAIDHEFIIFAHHGVQTGSDPPFTENSVNGAKHAEEYGCTGLEYDIQLTKDHVPICAHDASINIRVTQKGPVFGQYIQYNFDFLENYVRLTDGEKIPSLEQVLEAFVDSTTLKYFWMDVKGDPDIFKYLEPVIRNAYANAAAKHRDVVMFAGLPSQDVIDEFNKQPSYADLPTLCELSLPDVISTGSEFFGPRYTLGLLLNDVEEAHSKGIKVFSWTLNSKGLIRDYLVNGKFDGFITDYPAYVVYDFYTLF